MNIAVILAGGTGSRMYNETVRSAGSRSVLLPKQFMQLQGRAVIEYPIDTFDRHEAIDEVAVVVHPDWRGEMEAIVARNSWKKLTRLIDGGSERYMSTLNAVMAYIDCPDDTNLLLHDAARPFVSQEIIANVCQALEKHEAVVVAIPSTDTVYEMKDGKVARIPNRATIMRAQTPQAFRLPLIAEAYAKALPHLFNTQLGGKEGGLSSPLLGGVGGGFPTDDCGIVHEHMPEVPIYIVEGEEQNKKITFKEDI